MTAKSKTSNNDLSFNQNEDAMKLKLSSLKRRFDVITLGGGEAKIKKHHYQETTPTAYTEPTTNCVLKYYIWYFRKNI